MTQIDTFTLNIDHYIPSIAGITGLSEVTAVGNADILSEPRATILNSRQGKIPTADALWVRTTLNLNEELVKNGAVILSSVGMTTWELVTWKTGALGGKVILVLPEVETRLIPGMVERLLSDFKLEPSRTLMLFPPMEAQTDERYRKFPKRDFWISAMADRIYPVSVRNSGNLNRIVELFAIIPDKVSVQFRIDYTKPQAIFQLDKLPVLEVDEGQEWQYLTHWTRTALEPWPGETKADFYHALSFATAGFPRDGFHTLCKLLKDQKILSSDKLIKGRFETVSFTEKAPWELHQLIKWRPSLVRWTFEPYGIAITMDALEKAGARQVIYGYDYQYRFLQGDDRAFYQAFDPEGSDWRQEAEWRFLGDLDLSRFQPEEVIVIVQTFEEAEILGEWSPFPVKWWDSFGKVKD
jgi:hypothetical protein